MKALHPDEQLRRELLSDRLGSPNDGSATRRGSQIAALRFWFGLYRHAPAAVLGELYSATRPRSAAELANRCALSVVSIPVRISELRAAMEAEAIDTVAGCYLLTEVGRAECDNAFAAMAKDLQPERAAR